MNETVANLSLVLYTEVLEFLHLLSNSDFCNTFYEGHIFGGSIKAFDSSFLTSLITHKMLSDALYQQSNNIIDTN